MSIHKIFLLMTDTIARKYRQHHLLFFTPPLSLPYYVASSSFSSRHAKGFITQSENNINFGSVPFLHQEKPSRGVV